MKTSSIETLTANTRELQKQLWLVIYFDSYFDRENKTPDSQVGKLRAALSKQECLIALYYEKVQPADYIIADYIMKAVAAKQSASAHLHSNHQTIRDLIEAD